jgi:hypothetical protein
MKRLKWIDWSDSHILFNMDTNRNEAWVQQKPELGWRVQLWDAHAKPKPDWVGIAYTPELDAAKLIAQLNVED